MSYVVKTGNNNFFAYKENSVGFAPTIEEAYHFNSVETAQIVVELFELLFLFVNMQVIEVDTTEGI